MRLVHLVRDFRNDDRLAIAAQRLEFDLAAHHNSAAAEVVGGTDALAPQNDAASGKIRARDKGDQVLDRQSGIVDECHAGVDHLAEIVRRDIGRHADGDAAGTIDKKIGKARRQHHRLVLGIIVVGLKIDGILVDIAQQLHR